MPASATASGGYFSPRLRSREIGTVRISELHQPSQRDFPRHGHERPWFSFLLHGSYVERYVRRSIEQTAPAMAWHPAGIEHDDAVGESGGRFVVVELDHSWSGRNLIPNEPLSSTDPRAMIAGVRLLRALADDVTPLAIDETLHDLFDTLTAEPNGEGKRPRWLSDVIERLHAGRDESIDLGDLARIAGVDPAHLSRTFRRYVGCPPSRYLQQLRCIDVVRRLASGHHKSLADVALDSGFADQSHCTRAVGNLLGTTPGRLRALLRHPASPAAATAVRA